MEQSPGESSKWVLGEGTLGGRGLYSPGTTLGTGLAREEFREEFHNNSLAQHWAEFHNKTPSASHTTEKRYPDPLARSLGRASLLEVEVRALAGSLGVRGAETTRGRA